MQPFIIRVQFHDAVRATFPRKTKLKRIKITIVAAYCQIDRVYS